MTSPEFHDAAAAGPKRQYLAKQCVKALMALIVAVGLYFAVRTSVEQWREERESVAERLLELDRELASAESPDQAKRIRQEQNAIQQSLPSFENLDWRLIGLAGVLYALGLVPNGFLLHNALHALGQRSPLAISLSAHVIGHVGKYVPGKAMVLVLRTGILSRAGVKVLPATISIFLETFMMMAAGATLAALIVLFLPVARWVAYLALGIAIVAVLPTLPPVLRIAASRICKDKGVRREKRIGYGLFAVGWGWSLLAWALIGGAFAALILAVPTSAPLPSLGMVYAIGTAAISLAVVAGFASLLPGGAGIRELVLTTILSVALGTGHGLLAAIAARILFLVVEVTLAFGCWCWLGGRRSG